MLIVGKTDVSRILRELVLVFGLRGVPAVVLVPTGA